MPKMIEELPPHRMHRIPHFKRGLAAFTVMKICIGFSNFKLIDVGQRRHQLL
jgi:hypothetical protein